MADLPDGFPLLDPETERGLTEFLVALGADPEEITDAIRDDTLWELTTEVLLAPDASLTLDDVADRADAPVERVHAILAALGLAGAPAFDEDDVEVVVAALSLCDLYSDDEGVLRLLRVTGTSIVRMAEAAVASYIADIEKPLVDQGATILTHARAQAVVVDAAGSFAACFPHLFRRHVREVVQRGRVARRRSGDYNTALLAVGFVDLVGFTSLTRELAPGELSQILTEFETRSFTVIAANRGQLVKHIGDEIMFVSLEVEDACEIALALIEAFREPDARVTPRGGVTVGNLLTRDGDYYGVDVNLASRLTEIAVPQEILVSADTKRLAEKQTEDYVFEPAGRRLLKGFVDPIEVYTLTRG